MNTHLSRRVFMWSSVIAGLAAPALCRAVKPATIKAPPCPPAGPIVYFGRTGFKKPRALRSCAVDYQITP